MLSIPIGLLPSLACLVRGPSSDSANGPLRVINVLLDFLTGLKKNQINKKSHKPKYLTSIDFFCKKKVVSKFIDLSG
jgi:hypothetical protein